MKTLNWGNGHDKIRLWTGTTKSNTVVAVRMPKDDVRALKIWNMLRNTLSLAYGDPKTSK